MSGPAQRSLAVVCSIVWAGGSLQAQTVVYVDTHAMHLPADGTTWCKAYRQLSEALGAVEAGTVIRVADGTYYPDPTGLPEPREATLQLVDGVTIEGGYAGCGAPEPDERDVEAYVTILSGDLAGDDVGGLGDPSRDENCFTIVTAIDSIAAVLDGFTVTGGNGAQGAGMYIDRGGPTVIACTFVANSTIMVEDGDGGGVYIAGGSAELRDCTIIGNESDEDGGGLYLEAGDPTLTGCVFTANAAFNGGGMFSNSGHPTLTDCAFRGNSADWGGALHSRYGGLALTGCTFSGNSAKEGGALYNFYVTGSTSIIASACEFFGNSAHSVAGSLGRGGAIHNHRTDLTVVNSVFSGNYAEAFGGAMYGSYSEPRFARGSFPRNLAISGARVTQGGSRSSAGVFNCSFAGNSASDGRAVAFGLGPNEYTFGNCILWDGGDELMIGTGSTVDVTYSDVEEGWTGQGNIEEDPLFVDPDGPDGTIGTEDDNLRLLRDSPCVDAGDSSMVTFPYDLDGRFRIVDGDNDEVAIVDMGAYEFPRDAVPTVSAWGMVVMVLLVLTGGTTLIRRRLASDLPCDRAPRSANRRRDGGCSGT